MLNRPFESSLFLSGCWPYLLYQKENHFLVFYKKKRVSEKQKATEHFWTSSFFISGCISCTLFEENGLAAVSSLVLKGFASTFVKNIGFEIVLLPLLCLYYLVYAKVIYSFTLHIMPLILLVLARLFSSAVRFHSWTSVTLYACCADCSFRRVLFQFCHQSHPLLLSSPKNNFL